MMVQNLVQKDMGMRCGQPVPCWSWRPAVTTTIVKPLTINWKTDLKEEAGQHPTYGTRRLMHQLRRKPYGYQVNRKHIQRLAGDLGLLRPVKRRKIRTTNSQHPYPSL